MLSWVMLLKKVQDDRWVGMEKMSHRIGDADLQFKCKELEPSHYKCEIPLT